jgi:hypothetical protein
VAVPLGAAVASGEEGRLVVAPSGVAGVRLAEVVLVAPGAVDPLAAPARLVDQPEAQALLGHPGLTLALGPLAPVPRVLAERADLEVQDGLIRLPTRTFPRDIGAIPTQAQPTYMLGVGRT